MKKFNHKNAISYISIVIIGMLTFGILSVGISLLSLCVVAPVIALISIAALYYIAGTEVSNNEPITETIMVGQRDDESGVLSLVTEDRKAINRKNDRFYQPIGAALLVRDGNHEFAIRVTDRSIVLKGDDLVITYTSELGHKFDDSQVVKRIDIDTREI